MKKEKKLRVITSQMLDILDLYVAGRAQGMISGRGLRESSIKGLIERGALEPSAVYRAQIEKKYQKALRKHNLVTSLIEKYNQGTLTIREMIKHGVSLEKEQWGYATSIGSNSSNPKYLKLHNKWEWYPLSGTISPPKRDYAKYVWHLEDCSITAVGRKYQKDRGPLSKAKKYKPREDLLNSTKCLLVELYKHRDTGFNEAHRLRNLFKHTHIRGIQEALDKGYFKIVLSEDADDIAFVEALGKENLSVT